MQNAKIISRKKMTDFQKVEIIKTCFVIRLIEKKLKTEFRNDILRGVGLLLCYYPQEPTQNDFMNIFGKNPKSDSLNDVWNSVDQTILHHFRQWLLYLEIK